MKYDRLKPFAQNLPELEHEQRSLTQEDWDIKEKLGQHFRNWDYRDELIMLALAKARARGVRPVMQPLSVYMANLDRNNSYTQKPNYGYADSRRVIKQAEQTGGTARSYPVPPKPAKGHL